MLKLTRRSALVRGALSRMQWWVKFILAITILFTATIVFHTVGKAEATPLRGKQTIEAGADCSLVGCLVTAQKRQRKDGNRNVVARRIKQSESSGRNLTRQNITIAGDDQKTDQPRMVPRRDGQYSIAAQQPPRDFDKFREVYIDRRAGTTSQPCGAAGLGADGPGCQVRAPATPQAVAKKGALEEGRDVGTAPAEQDVVVITVTPYQAALMAMAELPLEPAKPGVGPPPTLNKWGMAAVGYPLWLWAEGNMAPAPVSTTVAGLTVSLRASMTSVDYRMGDGTTVTCGRGTKWRRGAAAAGTPSPTCGHTYTKPSLPKGSYTITATTHWRVAWTAGGQSGLIPFVQSSSTTLPVGELQVLVR